MGYDIGESVPHDQIEPIVPPQNQAQKAKSRIVDLGLSSLYVESDEQIAQDKQNQIDRRKYVPIKLFDAKSDTNKIGYVEIDHLMKRFNIGKDVILNGIHNPDISTQMFAERLEKNLVNYIDNAEITLGIAAEISTSDNNLLFMITIETNHEPLRELSDPIFVEIPLYQKNSPEVPENLFEQWSKYVSEYREAIDSDNPALLTKINIPDFFPVYLADSTGRSTEGYIQISDLEKGGLLSQEDILLAARKAFSQATATMRASKETVTSESSWFGLFSSPVAPPQELQSTKSTHFAKVFTRCLLNELKLATADRLRRETLEERLATAIDPTTRQATNRLFEQLPKVDFRSLQNLRDTSPEVFRYMQIERMRSSSSLTLIATRHEGERLWHETDAFMWQLAERREPLTLSDLCDLHKRLCDESLAEIGGILRGVTNNQCGAGNGLAFLAPRYVFAAVEEFLIWLNDRIAACELGEDNPICIAASAYQRLVSIHPFDDVNGRLSRCIMDYVLRRFDVLPCTLGADIRDAAFVVQYSLDDPRFTTALNDRAAQAKTPTHVIESVMYGIQRSYQYLGLTR